MGRRRDQRVPMALPVRVFGTDAEGKPFTRLAHTVDISASGARVGGLYVPLVVGDVIGIQHGPKKSRFRVIWIGKKGGLQAGEVGVQCMEPDKGVWNLSLPEGGPDNYEPQSVFTERRSHVRLACDFGIEIRTDPRGLGTHARCTDISHGGCYLETWSPWPVGTTLFLTARLASGTLQLTAKVRTSHPAFGMGMQFVSTNDTLVFNSFLDELAMGENCTTKARDGILLGNGADVDPGPSETRQASSSSIKASSRRVLVIEDSRFLRMAYATYLRREGFEVLTAADGEEGLKVAASMHPAAIVLDVLMPNLGGVDALKLLKDDPVTRSVPVIIVSGLSQGNEARLISAGAAAYCEKAQCRPEQVPGIVNRVLRQSETPDSLLSPPAAGSGPMGL